ncbi:MAG TPA: DUF4350 domain-containing protein [Leucothrix sp.]|nr:DUF4350 domain-containing protein [Leucothrix sp.]
MSKLSSAIIALLVLLLIAYGAYDFYLKYEYKEKTIHTGYKDEARKNPFYASRLFLKRMGIPTETKNSIQDLSNLPDTNTLIIITTRRTTLSPQRTNDLIDWVKSGGHLMALATSDWKYSGSEKIISEEDEDNDSVEKKGSPDPLQRFMGVDKAPRSLFYDDEDEEDEGKDTDNGRTIPDLKLRVSDKPLKLDDPMYRPILVDDKHKAQTEEVELGFNNYIVRQKIGNGLVTLITDMGFIQNYRIESADHAEILWQLVHGLHKPLNQPSNIWLIHNDKMPPLWDILWRNFWALILSLALLLLFWLYKSSQRFGPMIPKEEENRRSLNEHITSSANFYWKNNKKQILINSSRKALTQHLSRVYPSWTQHTEEEQIKLLAEQLSMKAESLHKLLYAQNIEQADEFTQLIKQLDKIRKNI